MNECSTDPAVPICERVNRLELCVDNPRLENELAPESWTGLILGGEGFKGCLLYTSDAADDIALV